MLQVKKKNVTRVIQYTVALCTTSKANRQNEITVCFTGRCKLKCKNKRKKKRGINSHNKFRTEESFKGLHCVINHREKKNTQNKKIVDTKVDTEISIIIIITYKPG